MNNKKDKENFFKRFTDLILFLSLGLLFFVLGIIGLLNKQDYKLYDLLLKLKKSPTESEQILLVDIDNISISEIGEWPWSRDIIADALFRMKEFGAKAVTFDIEYLSPSPLGVPRTSENAITDSFNYIQDEIESIVYELSDSVEKGYISPNTINEQTNIMFNDYINPSIDNFKNNLVTSLLYQDNDEYFGKALKFFDNSWVTVNTRDLNIVYTHDDIAFVENNYLLNNVSDSENHIRKNNIYTVNEQYGGIPEGFSPTLHTLVKRAKGCGFTNVQIDTDGSRRRIELLFYRNGKYLPQLVFAPLLNMLDVQSIQRTKHKLILNGCLFPKSETRETVSIPLDNHGRMFINWIKPDYDNSFRHVSLSDTFKLDCIENEHIIYFENLLNYEILNENGTPLDYLVKIKNFNDEYNAIIQEKNSLLKLCEADSKFNISDEQYSSYFNRRNQYFKNLKEFLDTDIISSVTQRLDELGDLITENDRLDFVQVVSEQIDLLKDSVNEYVRIFDELSNKYKNSFCIIGNTASSTTDMGATPFWRMYPNVGTHANIVNTILNKDFISTYYWELYYLLSFILMGIAILIFRKRSSRTQNISYGFISIILIATPFVLFLLFNFYIPSLAATFFLIINFIVNGALRFMNAEKQKGFLRQAFSTYVSKDVVTEIVNDPSKLKLGGEERELSALFTDIKGFSSFSELVSPSKLISILNEYLGALSDIILQNNGTIDKYIGDSIVSFFGAPINIHDHAFKACCSAIRMKEAEYEFNKKHMIDGDIPRELFSRIGINTGRMLVGNMGTAGKLNYTVIGSEVNLASRLEGVNKVYDSSILVSEKTWTEANYGENKDIIVAKKLDKVRVVGIDNPVQLYNIIGFKSEMSNKQLEEIEIFHSALDEYFAKNFTKAAKLFMEAYQLLPDDKTALIFAERCSNYAKKNIPAEWDGVRTLTSK